jgi:hypothetical protein
MSTNEETVDDNGPNVINKMFSIALFVSKDQITECFHYSHLVIKRVDPFFLLLFYCFLLYFKNKVTHLPELLSIYGYILVIHQFNML